MFDSASVIIVQHVYIAENYTRFLKVCFNLHFSREVYSHNDKSCSYGFVIVILLKQNACRDIVCQKLVANNLDVGVTGNLKLN